MKDKMEMFYRWLEVRRDKLFLIAVVIGSAITVLVGGLLLMAKNAQENLASEVLRFHVLANSDSEEDQALKLLVKDEVIAYLADELQQADSLEETERLLQERLPEIRQVALKTLADAGSDQSVAVEIAESDFPTKRYGSVSLPAGCYRALRIELGDGEGANWWCMMFPALCFVEEGTDTLPEETENSLAEQLPEEDNALIHQEEAGFVLKIKFKLIEWWAAIFG